MRKLRWIRIEEGDFIIVVPEFDSLPHGFPESGEVTTLLAGSDCPCKPTIQFVGDMRIMITHNCFFKMSQSVT